MTGTIRPTDEDAAREDLLQKAINLFTFLGNTQRLLIKPVLTADKYEKVIWFADLPDHPAIRSTHQAGPVESDDKLLSIDRIPRAEPPIPPQELLPWLVGDIHDAHDEPGLRDAIDSPDIETPERPTIELAEVPEITRAFEEWLDRWQPWAAQERRDAAVRDVYKELFAVQLASTDHSEEFELVLGLGCLSWRPDGHEQVRRHVAAAPVSIAFDEVTGTLTVNQVTAPESVSIEVDMLDPSLITAPAQVDEIRQLAASYDGHLFERPGVGELCRRLINRLHADAEFDDGADAPTSAAPRGAFAPALILRRRTNRGLVQIFDTIVAQLRTAQQVPSGILPLVDPDLQPVSDTNPEPGAIVSVGDEDFLPLPVNEQQRRIIDRVDQTAQTVVQGPPGTGKTHTAAALVSNLLAKGMRVLITAQTDRALQEVRAKLPRQIQALAVSVIGQSRSDMADLRTAVDNISRRADEFDMAESTKSINRHVARIAELGKQRADAYRRLIAIRRQEVEHRIDGPEEGTLAAIAFHHLQDRDAYQWIRDFDVQSVGRDAPISSTEILRWRALLMDNDIAANEDEARQKLPDLTAIPTPAQFAALVDAEAQAVARRESFEKVLAHESFGFVRSLPPPVRDELRRRVSELATRAADLERRDEAWIDDALRDVRSGRQQMWLARATQVKQFADQADALIRRFGPTTTVSVSGGDPAAFQQIARALFGHLEAGNKIKVLPDGSPKIGPFAGKVLKAAEPFFAGIRVNGLPAVTREQLGAFIDWVETARIVAAMDQAWPNNVPIPDEDTFAEKVQWHRTEVDQLDRVLALGHRIHEERDWFESNNLPLPDWNNLDAIRRYATLVEAATAVDEAASAAEPIDHVFTLLTSAGPTPPPVTEDLRTAVRTRDATRYSIAHGRLAHLLAVARKVSERDRIGSALRHAAPDLAAAIKSEPTAQQWDTRLRSFEEAWRWEMTGRWILTQETEDSNTLKIQLSTIEDQIRNEVEHLAAERAWRHAVAPGRLTGSARANLTQYAQLVSSLGKGTGKYAAKQRAEIAEAMDRCRPSVPVWIMPIYRIAEQMRVHPDLFDVVIVDEASQAGLEASFLQYLAPKVVVIGDDKQVSPSAVGVDQQQLRDLANLYLADDAYKASWLNPKRSYFDEANMRFGGRITLTEHRRCAPEIIGFSNRVAYEPEGIRLVPVRQFGAERLDPIKVVHIADGVELANRTNEVEAQAIVDQIGKCIADPQYDGATIGVISLLGKEQARLIERRLLDSVAPDEWAARELRCGDASDFQGSERDVMFLSMVKAPQPDTRLTALTAGPYVQRFNVAASRAKDQMWVFHSMPRDALTNTEDMRFQLLDYCYNTAAHADDDAHQAVSQLLPDDVLVPPFESLFAQRVCNRIVEQGYTVIPRFSALGYPIDLVVVGAKHRLAIECEGDRWAGPEQYEVDLAQQRELERCGWEFFRIRESLFYADMPGTLQKLWDTLDELDIRTADWIDSEDDESDVGDESESATESTAESISGPIVETATHVVAGHGGGRHRAANWSDTDDAGSELPIADVAASNGLAPYVTFTESLPAVTDTSPRDLAKNIARIVEVEGPILGHRLHQVYVRASGGLRVGRELARVLNQAIAAAQKQGLITADNPLNESGIKPKTFRTPDQPSVRPRELGPRALDAVPPAELAHHLATLAAEDPYLSEEELFRGVLDRLGLKRLTENARSNLVTAMLLVSGPDDESTISSADSDLQAAAPNDRREEAV